MFDNSCSAVRSLVTQGTQIKGSTTVTQIDNIFIHVVYLLLLPKSQKTPWQDDHIKSPLFFQFLEQTRIQTFALVYYIKIAPRDP